MSEPATIQVYYDASCPLCRASRRWAERRDPSGAIGFSDLASPGSPVGDDARATGNAAQLVVRDDRGGLARGYDAWVRILAALPGWDRRARLLALPQARPVGWLVYRAVARLRNVLRESGARSTL